VLIKKDEKELQQEKEEERKEDADKDEEEMEEELVEFEDSQDRQLEQQEGHDDWPESQESFGTKVGKITRGRLKEKTRKQDKPNKIESSVEEARRCPRLKNQEFAERIELAMRRTEKKNTIHGNISNTSMQVPTILNSEDYMLADMTSKIGVVSSNDKEVHRIIFVVKSLEQTRKDMFLEIKKDKSMLQPTHTNLFTQVTEEVEEMACDSESDVDIAGDDTYHGVVKLGRSKRLQRSDPLFLG
jgi:hypothetical protein